MATADKCCGYFFLINETNPDEKVYIYMNIKVILHQTYERTNAKFVQRSQ